MLSQVIEDGQITDSYFTVDPLTLNTKNADALILGSSTTEGGDIKVYRDTAGNLQMSVDADAANNTKALDIYGGVVAQNYLTVGSSVLNTVFRLHVSGSIHSTSTVSGIEMYSPMLRGSNDGTLRLDVRSMTSSSVLPISLSIDSNDIIVAQATGDGAGGIVNKAIGLYGTTPVTQAGVISDPAESIAGNNAAIDSILVALRGIGLIAT